MRMFMIGTSLNQTMRGYPHFTSPLNNVRDIKEMLYMYKRTGKFFARPSQIGQSEILLQMIFYISEMFTTDNYNGAESGIYFFSTIGELLSLAMQLILFYCVFSISEKKSKYSTVALLWITFNPISLIGGFSYIGSFNDALFYMVIALPLLDEDPNHEESDGV